MGTIVVLTGKSGSGKTSIARRLLEREKNFRMVESITTRAERSTDLPGEYRYVDRTEMERLKRSGGLLWSTPPVGGHIYATARASVDEVLGADADCYGIMILVPAVGERLQLYVTRTQGSAKRLVPFLIRSPDTDVLRERMRRRGQDPAAFETMWNEQAGWEGATRRSILGYTPIDNPDGALEDAVDAVCSRIALL